MEWISVKDHLPKKDIADCLITIDCFGVSRYIKTVSYAKDLSKVDEYYFPANMGGFYDYNTECGYYEIDNVLAWCEIKPYEGE